MTRIWPRLTGALAGLLCAAGLTSADNKQIGSIDVHPGQELSTGNGNAELLLTPGVFLRCGDHSGMR